MFALFMRIASSTAITLIMRFSDKKTSNNMAMFMANYAVCSCLSYYYMTGAGTQVFQNAEGIGFTIGIGLISGIWYLAAFLFMQWNMRENGVVLSSTFNRLGVLVPTIMAMVVFKESPKMIQIIGIVIALVAIVLMQFEKGGDQGGNKKIWLVVMLLSSGFCDSLTNVYDKLGNPILKDNYLLYTFFVALLCATALTIREKNKISKWDLFFGFIIGVPNYYSSRFMFEALKTVPAVIAYPVSSVGTILAISVGSVILFKEKVSNQKKFALVLVMAAMALLNM
ncbi:MAG: EamA family transporter [Lachnospiraceae bacterium]|nr:EamA family transporter [Lachnospiraceae bacterium]